MANIITFGRLVLLFVVIWIAYTPASWLHFVNVALLIVVFVSDALDGYVARKNNETSVFGAMFDIAADRIAELSLWVVLTDLNLVPVWVPLLFIVRGSIVDAIRARTTAEQRKAPFAIMQAPLSKFLVAGKFMRGFYAAVKGHAFCWLLLIQPLPVLFPSFWAQWGAEMTAVGFVLVWLSVLLCVARGAPVILEFFVTERGAEVDSKQARAA